MPKLAVCGLVLALAASAEELTPIFGILARPDAFDGKPVCVAGKTSTLFNKYSRKGNHYFSVWVSDGKQRIKVFSLGFPSFVEGETIEACGVFTRVKKVSDRLFYDELTASVILKGPMIRSGQVELTNTGVIPAKPKAAPKAP